MKENWSAPSKSRTGTFEPFLTLSPPASCPITNLGISRVYIHQNRGKRKCKLKQGQRKLTEQVEKTKRSLRLCFQPEAALSTEVATSHVGPLGA